MEDQFKREIKKQGLPFVSLFSDDADFREALYKEYLQAEKIPCYDLYLFERYTPDQVEQMILAENRESELRTLHWEFIEMQVKKTLPEKYLAPDIKKTPIIKALVAIESEITLFKKAAIDNTTDKYKEPEIRAKNVQEASKVLGTFADKILNHIKEDDFNIFLHFHPDRQSKWDAIKNNFNSLLQVPTDAPEINFENEKLIFTNLKELQEHADKVVAGGFISLSQKELFIQQLAAINPDKEKKVDWLGSNTQLIGYMTKIVGNQKRNVAYAKKIFNKPCLKDNEYKGETIPVINKLFR